MYTKITSKYPDISKPDMSNPKMKPTELPHQPKQVDFGVGIPKAAEAIREFKKRQTERLHPRTGVLKDIINVYRKHPGRKYPSA
jgi:hypothetical protein